MIGPAGNGWAWLAAGSPISAQARKAEDRSRKVTYSVNAARFST